MAPVKLSFLVLQEAAAAAPGRAEGGGAGAAGPSGAPDGGPATGDGADGVLREVNVSLGGGQSLAPLFEAFDLPYDESELGPQSQQFDPDGLLSFLQEQVGQAVALGRENERLKTLNSTLTANLVEEYGLLSLVVGQSGFSGVSEQKWVFEATTRLSSVLCMLGEEELALLRGNHVQLHKPALTAEDFQNLGDDGRLHFVADDTLPKQIRSLDAMKLETFTKLDQYWKDRVEVLLPAVTSLLRVKNIVSDHIISTVGEETDGAQAAVLWAGKVLGSAEAFDLALQGKTFSFSLLIHGDYGHDYVSSFPGSTVVQVRDDCPAHVLLKFLCSEAVSAQATAERAQSSRDLENQLFEDVRRALNATHVIRVCPSGDMDLVADAARRLLLHADAIQEHVDLTGVCLAIDNCYEVWDSGFISIPYDFELEELCHQLGHVLPAPVEDPVGPPIDQGIAVEEDALQGGGAVNLPDVPRGKGAVSAHAVRPGSRPFARRPVAVLGLRRGAGGFTARRAFARR